MKKIEERAVEYGRKQQGTVDIEVYEAGYRQAEKDLELTVDDIMKLDALLIEMWNRPSNEDKYQEVLKRFNKERKEK